MARLALHQPDARSAARLTAALGEAHELIATPTWDDLLFFLVDSAAEGCLLDADHPTPMDAVDRITELRSRHPGLAIIGYTDRRAPLEYYRLGASGLEGFVSGVDGPIRTRAAVDAALALARGRRVTQMLSTRVPEPLPRLVGWVVAHAGPDVTLEHLARSAGHSIGSLRAMLRSRGLPAPSTLLLWGKLMSAGLRIHRDGRSIEETAFALGYSAANSLTRALRVHTGLTVGELAADGGSDRVIEAFVTAAGAHEPDLNTDSESHG